MGTRYKGTKKEVRVLNAYITLMRAAESVTSRLNPRLTAAGLTVRQFGALEALYHLGPLCQRELGEKLLKSSGDITMVVDNLEKRGLVRRERAGEDRRFVTVHLTEKGRRFIGEFFPHHVKSIVDEMGTLTDSEQEELRRLCRKVGRKVGK
ncbi:MAG: MarR family transcriptional regulator [Candidatus Tectomicrobia bacterium]|uniref:MarR family transcriptional regulator n=1 Tax=Tectimicrobiota bacterium TaxID=2528274 RepID=A0A932GNZ9_UNCTE|nr:MarR family transcriptional regulator [Candidatus Tectomicrobia bacterium]